MNTDQIPNGKDIIDDGILLECLPIKLFPLPYEVIFDMQTLDNIILGNQKEIHLLSSRNLKLEAARPLIKAFVDEKQRVFREMVEAASKNS